MNRLSRDEIIHYGLDLADIPTLDASDRPDGVLLPRAKSIAWFQMALDAFSKRFPFATTVTTVEMLAPVNDPILRLAEDTTKMMPNDFNLDVQDGLMLRPNDGMIGRMRKRSLQSYLDITLQFQNHRGNYPVSYCVFGDHIKVTPVTDERAYLITMWYFQMKPPLKAEEIPQEMDEWALAEFIRMKALEWIRLLPPDSAKTYLNKELANLKTIGLMHNMEREKLPLQNIVYLDAMLGTSSSPFAWMGTW